jgi:hypothetical protein
VKEIMKFFVVTAVLVFVLSIVFVLDVLEPLEESTRRH